MARVLLCADVMIYRSLLVSFFLAMTACGSEVSNPDLPAGGRSTTPPSDDRAASADDPPASESVGAAAQAPAVAIRNTATSSRWIVVDFQRTPVDFAIGEPALQLNGYGLFWCGGPTDNHNDPGVYFVEIEGGATASLGWRAISVTREGDCWKGTSLAPGSYPTKACFYEQRPANVRVPGDVSDVTPRTCVDTTLVVPEGASSVTFDL